MIWMVSLGYLVFGDVPGLATIAGAAVIILSGLYILYRERVHGDR
jgi:drug/metabolite transporter (DMT)-like permease